jgi:hypothetical protein
MGKYTIQFRKWLILHINRRTVSKILHGYRHSKYQDIKFIEESLQI